MAWNDFKTGKQFKKDVLIFAQHLDINLFNLYESLKNKIYTHSPYTHFKINDPKPRDIHKATVSDRIVHHLIYNALYDHFNKKFIHDSYSCRINKGPYKATTRFQSFYNKVSKNNTKTVWVLRCDIKKFFASIDHNILKQILHKHILDTGILSLLNNTIDSFETRNTNNKRSSTASILTHRSDLWERERKGLPLGNLTSQLLVNIYMNEFDQYVKHNLKVKYYIRYADDFVVLSSSKDYLQNLLTKMSEFLNTKLKLQMHPNKVFIKTYAGGVDFLGWVHFPKYNVLRTVTKKRMFRNLNRNSYKKASVNSYLGMLGHGSGYKLQKEICFRQDPQYNLITTQNF